MSMVDPLQIDKQTPSVEICCNYQEDDTTGEGHDHENALRNHGDFTSVITVPRESLRFLSVAKAINSFLQVRTSDSVEIFDS